MPANKKFKLVPKHDSALVSRWRKAVEVAGDYLKNLWRVIHPSNYLVDMFNYYIIN